MSASSSVLRRLGAVFLFLAVTVVWFGNLDYRKLVRTDEGRYAEIAREMALSGDWVTPRLNGVKYFEKPPLQYWVTAAAYTAFGEHEWTSRLWPALTGFLGILLVGFTGARLFGTRAGLFAAAVLGSSFLYVGIGHMNTLDMGVAFFMGAGLCAFLRAQYAATPAAERGWMVAAWAAMACAVLSKGLIGIALPGAVLVLYSLWQRDMRLWRRMHFAVGLPVFLALATPWFVAAARANPEFLRFFFIHEHFERFLTTVHGRAEPWWYFVPVLLAGIFPWVLPMGAAIAAGWKPSGAPGDFQPRRFLLLWTVFIFAFFSLSGSKLPSYILPIFPALALLMGAYLAEVSGRVLFWQIAPLTPLALAGLVLAPRIVARGSAGVPAELYQHYVPWLEAAAATLMSGSLLALFWSRRLARVPAVLALAGAGLLSAQLVLCGHESLSPANSYYQMAEQIRPYMRPEQPFYSVEMYEQTLPFYIKRTVTVVAWRDELGFGFDQEPDKWIPQVETFKTLWRAQPGALAIMGWRTYDRLQREGLPMRIVGRNARDVVVQSP